MRVRVGIGTVVTEYADSDQVAIELPHGHAVTITDLDTDVVIVMKYPDGEEIALESVMKSR